MSGGFSFGQPSKGFTFGAQKTTPAGSGGGFTFGSPTQANSNSTAALSFGTAKSTAAGKGFSFGTPITTFGLGSTPQTTTAAGMTFGSMAAPPRLISTATPAGGGFTFGNSTQTSTNSTGTLSLSTPIVVGRDSLGTPPHLV
ncbi:nucleoporin nup189-like protein [Lates japonicus]|uniref:Nucleoporin nup189-like protein n=1 Tax=Lates japonicus TaxID=270547 RepID=A0AAD3N7V8_LATJO|nr:nucleoporin nup189-like protein [Lates japonicus]